jgi:hypothetical protein
MKLTSSISALVAVVGLALASAPVTLQAQTTATTTATGTTTPVKKSSPKTTEYQGTLTAIDPTANTITVTTSASKMLVMAITPKTKYKSSAPALANFAVGDAVSGSYTKDATGAMTAYSLHKKTAKAKKAATAAAAPATPAAAPAPAAQ